jgi:Tol biopolymer transport system component
MTENRQADRGPRDEGRLESWKEIAGYLRRDVSTLKRWEKHEGLPVHRHLHQARASVYAYPSELDDWRARRQPGDGAAGSMPRVPRRVRIAALAAPLLLALASSGDGRALRAASPGTREGTLNRLVWSGPLVDPTGAPAPDGHYIAITDWETGNLAVREMPSGAVRRLTDNQDGREWAEFPVPSPDGRSIVYTWINGRARGELRVRSLVSSSDRVLYARPDVEYPRPFGWTQDGSAILSVLTRTDRTHEIALVSVKDGSSRVLKRMDGRSPGNVALSPDDRFVAYDFSRRADSLEHDVFLLRVDGGEDEVLIAHPADDLVVGWTWDGRRLLFASDRTGRMGLWALRMAEGRALEPPELLRPDLPLVRPMGLTRDGALYYIVRTGVSDIYVAALDATTAAVVSPPAPFVPRFVGWNRSPDWSADGQLVAYASERESPPRSMAGLGGTIVVRRLASGEEREVDPRLETMGSVVRWSPDGESFLTSGRDPQGRAGIFTIDATTGETSLVVRHDPPGFVQFPAWSSDGASVFYLLTTPEAANRLHVQNLRTGDDREVFPRSVSNVALSPDGRSMAVRVADPLEGASVLAIVPVEGGEARELVRLSPPDALPPWSGLAWTPDGRYVLFTRTKTGSGSLPFELWRTPVEGGAAEKTGIAMTGLRCLRVHPDGQRIVFGAGQIQHEAWVLEHFLPPAESDD